MSSKDKLNPIGVLLAVGAGALAAVVHTQMRRRSSGNLLTRSIDHNSIVKKIMGSEIVAQVCKNDEERKVLSLILESADIETLKHGASQLGIMI
ncbi:hypothetical protein EPN15_02380 [Patescibacteria group bacterium]|nr:MAG: hypothetical protein EPN15_02380 [Patescibacteria group bacterium]